MLTDEEFKCFLKALGTRIKAIRKDKNLNMRDIMIATGHYDAQWRKYEAGGSMNLMSLMKVALALDVSLVELLDGLGQWPKRSVAEIESRPMSGKARDEPEAALERKGKTTSKMPASGSPSKTLTGAQQDHKSAR